MTEYCVIACDVYWDPASRLGSVSYRLQGAPSPRPQPLADEAAAAFALSIAEHVRAGTPVYASVGAQGVQVRVAGARPV